MGRGRLLGGRYQICLLAAALVLTACTPGSRLFPTPPPLARSAGQLSPSPSTPEPAGAGSARATPVSQGVPTVIASRDLTALEAIDRAQTAVSGLPRESWLITAEARAQAPGGRLGAAREWLLLYRQLDGPILKLTVPEYGQVTLLELPGGPWTGGRIDRFRIAPAAVSHDSQWATRLGDVIGGAAFLRTYPGSRRSIVLDHAMGDPLTWTVEYQSPDGYWVLTFIIEDATGDILHRSLCEYTPAAMARPGLPNCERDSERKQTPFVPPLDPSPEWDLL